LKYKESARYLGEVFDASRLMSQSERGKEIESSECIQKVSKTRGAWSWRHGSMLLEEIHSMKQINRCLKNSICVLSKREGAQTRLNERHFFDKAATIFPSLHATSLKPQSKGISIKIRFAPVAPAVNTQSRSFC
jgi:hypothetical protein